MSDARMLALMREIEVLSHFDDAGLGRLARHGVVTRFAPGEKILTDGAPPSHFYVIIQGEASIRRAEPTGIVTFWRLEPGELLGVTSFVTGRSYVDTSVAEYEVTAVAFERESLLAAAGSDPALEQDLYWAFWTSLANNIRSANRRLAAFFEGENGSSKRLKLRAARGGDLELDPSAKKALFREQMLSDAEVDLLAAVARERRYSPGHVIFAEGDEGDEMYVIHEGSVSITRFMGDAGEEALAFLERGEYFGELVLVGEERRSANAKARTDGAVVLVIPGSEVKELLDDRSQTSIALLKLLSSVAAQRLGGITRKITGWYALAGGDSF